MRPILLVLAASTCLVAAARAQANDTLRVDLDAVEVAATRVGLTAATAPLAVTVEAREPLLRATDPGAALEAVLRHLPGLWVADRENVALGERLAVRGMGARAPFGVRGVHIVLDGIPLTMADGQSALLITDPSLVRRAELIRGPASSLWGNASGGVLFLSTIPDERRLLDARTVAGSFGLARFDAEVVQPVGRGQAGAALSHTRRDGYREHSAFEITRGRAFARTTVGGNSTLTATGAFEWAPLQQHPGALTADELALDPRLAQSNFVSQRAGKDSRQGQAGVQLSAPTPMGAITASAYGVVRSMVNPLPFAVIDLNRTAAGARIALERTDGPVRWSAGTDVAWQRDDRQNFANAAGERGERRLDQLELVTGVGGFAQAHLGTGPFNIVGGLRYDFTNFRADDRFLIDGDHSGQRGMGAWSPALGASMRLGPAVVFAALSTAFETPTATELVNRPDGGGGFNPELQPQRTHGAEVGARGTDPGGRVFFDVALFRLWITDQLTSFVGEDGRTYFLNADEATHGGLEAYVEWQATPAVGAALSYAWSHFVFGDGTSAHAGNRIPGLPRHRLSARLHFERSDFFGHASVIWSGPVYADDANETQIDGFHTIDLRAGYSGLVLRGARLLPFLQVQNLLNATYVGSVAINAAGGRFFEPAAARSVQAGVSLQLRG